MIRKPVVAILAALAVSCFAMPAAAETFTSGRRRKFAVLLGLRPVV